MKATNNKLIECLSVNDVLIPLWDKDVSFRLDDYFGDCYTYQGKDTRQIVEAVLNISTKEITPGIILDYYPPTNKGEYKIGDDILYTHSHRKLKKSKIVKIEFPNYNTTITKGSEVDIWTRDCFPDVKFEDNQIYCIKSWEPHYVMKDGFQTKWTHELYKMYK